MPRLHLTRTSSNDTKQRLLNAAEALFIEHGYDAMLLRDVTRMANANLAAVNYHFGGKEMLVRELLAPRLDQLNRDRLQLLECCEAHQEQGPVDAATLLSVLFVPALRQSRPPAGNALSLRLLCRVYSDTSPFIHDFLREHYRSIFKRFFAAFARALPALPKDQLKMRLRLSLQSVAGLVAAEGMETLTAAISMGKRVDDSVLLARIVSLVVPLLTAPDQGQEHAAVVSQVLGCAEAMDRETRLPE